MKANGIFSHKRQHFYVEKAIGWGVLFICLIVIAFGVTGSVQTFYGKSNPFNLSLTSGVNTTVYLRVPLYAYVQNVTINLAVQGEPLPIADRLVAVYTFDGAGDLIDNFGAYPSDHDSVPSSNKKADGIHGYAWNFSAYKNTRVNMSNDLIYDVLNGSEAFTFNWWVNYNDPQSFYTNEWTAFSPQGESAWRKQLGALPNPMASFITTVNDNQAGGQLNTALARNNYWAMHTLMYNGTHLLAFVNGTQYLNDAGTGGWTVNRTFILGTRGSDRYMNGRMDEFYIWNRSMNETEVSWLYSNQSTGEYFNFSASPGRAGLDLYVGDSLLYSYTSLNTASSNITTAINNVLSSGCDCEGCSISSNQCLIPLTFNGPTATIQVNLTNATYKYGIDNCINSFNIPSNATTGNITFYDTSDNMIEVQHNVNLQYGSSTKIYNLSFTNTGTNSTLCIYPSYASFIGDLLISYQNNSIFHEFNAYNINFTNETKQFKNYISPGTTEVTFTVIDSSDIPQGGYLIKIQEFNVAENAYLTHEVLKTDSSGQAVGNIVLGEKYYHFIVSDTDGNVVLIDPSTQGVRLYSISKILTVGDTQDIYFTGFNSILGVSTSLTFNNDTSTFSWAWDNPDGSSVEGCLRVDEYNSTGDFTIFDSCSTSSSATITKAISPKSGARFFAQGYFKVNPNYIVDTLEKIYQEVFSFIGNKQEASYVAFLVVAALALVGVPFPMVSLILMVFGLLVVVFSGLFVINPSLIVSILVIGMIHGYRSFKGK